jgi:hypothetical protein
LPRLNSGDIHFVWVDYDGTTMNIFLNTDPVKPGTPTLTGAINLASIFGGQTQLYVGFTAGTGGAIEAHDVLGFEFNAVPEPSSMTLFGMGLAAAAVVGWRRRATRR